MIDEAQAADTLLDAAGLDRSHVPPRAFGADWFREQPNWLAASLAADTLVRDLDRSPASALMAAAELLEDDDVDRTVHELVAVGFVEAMICSASHLDSEHERRIIDVAPVGIWRIWHQRCQRLEALSEQRSARITAPPGLHRGRDHEQMLARCTTYRAESGRYVVLADLISADRPSPWPLRHPVLVGLIFGAFMLVMLVLSLARTF